MNDYFLSIRLINIASFLFIFGGIFIGIKIANRTGKSFLRILFGFERRTIIKFTTPTEKFLIVCLFVYFFFLSYLDIHDIKTISDIISAF